MKMILITYNQAIDTEVMKMLSECAVANYTKWTRVLGKGKTSGPHLDTHVWPKANNVLAVALEDKKHSEVISRIRELRENLGKEGIKAFVLPLEEAT